MEPRLSVEAQGGGHGEGELRLGTVGRADAERFRRLELPCQRFPLGGGIEVRRGLGEIAVDPELPDHAPVFRDGALVGVGVLPRRLLPRPLDQPVVDEPVLAGDLGGGVFRLPAAHARGLQQHGAQPRRLQEMRGQHARHPAADDGRVHVEAARERRPFRQRGGFAPDGFAHGFFTPARRTARLTTVPI